MACEVRGQTILCGRGLSSLGQCQECFQRPATRLCDGPLPRGMVHRRSSIPGADKTCSKPLCADCSIVDGDNDYCPSLHRDPASRKLAL